MIGSRCGDQARGEVDRNDSASVLLGFRCHENKQARRLAKHCKSGFVKLGARSKQTQMAARLQLVLAAEMVCCAARSST